MNERAFLTRVLLGNEEAVAFMESIGAICQVWDDLIDIPGASAPRINAAFWEALIALPNNGFYQRHFDTLNPLMQSAIADWLAANELEKGSEHDKRLAYVLRDATASLAVHCARLVGGYGWMLEVNAEIRRYFMDEPIEQYLEEHKA